MLKRRFLIPSLCTLICLAGCSNQSEHNPIAHIGESVITEQELYDQLKEKAGKDVLKQMTFDLLLNKYYSVTVEELEMSHIATLHSQGLKSEDQFNAYLKRHGLTKEEFKENIKTQLLLEKASLDEIYVSEEDLRSSYEDFRTKVRASHILVSDMLTAQEVLNKLDKGDSFADLAASYSTDQSTSQIGGDLGYFNEGFIDKEIVDTAFSLNIGEVSSPIKTEFGYHLIQTTDKGKSFEEMKDTLNQTLIEKRKKTIEEIFETLLQKEDIQIHESELDFTINP